MTFHAWADQRQLESPGGRRTPRGINPLDRVLELQRQAGNQAVAGALAASPPPRRVTGYLGLNPGVEKELAGLRKASKQEVLGSLNDPVAEKRLRQDPAVFDFVVDELGISVGDFRRWDRATDVLLNADPHLREQLADVMRWFNRAETGEIVLERLVLSGHSNGVELWGEYKEGDESRPGTMLVERDLGTIAEVFPKAAAQVEDVMFSACFSINAVEVVKKVFPSLRTVWSYGGFSPSVATGSIEHIITWTIATEGEKTLGRGLKRGSNALWTREKGYIVGDPSAAAAGPLYAEVVRGWREQVEPYYDGRKETPKSFLDGYYVTLQRLIAHPGAAEDLKEKARKVYQAVLRLRFWPLVAKRFGSEHGPQIRPAYEALGVPEPKWESLSRTELKAHVEAMTKALEGSAGASFREPVKKYLVNGLYRLDPQIIRSDWI